MLTHKAAEHLRRAGLYDWVTLVPPREKQNLTLNGTLKNFEELVVNEKRMAKVTIHFELQNSQPNELVWSKEISSSVPIENSGVDGIVQAMSTATQQVFDELARNLGDLQ